MNQFEEIMKKSGWFYKTGPENDVIISSRVRFTRNLMDYPFPHMLSREEDEKVKNLVVNAFSNLKNGNKYTVIRLDDVSSIEKNILLERNLMTRDYSKQGKGVVLISEDGEVSGMVNGEDHLRFACIKTGYTLDEAFEKMDLLDTTLENSLAFASSVEWGYLTSSLKNLGTGVRFSVLVHLPALEYTSLLSETLNLILEKGFTIKGFQGADNHSLGDIYQISNRVSLGFSENEILTHMKKLLKPLILLERKTREAVYKNKKREIEDKILRALGILKYCRMITINEAAKYLSLVRLGVCLGVITDITLEKVTTLFFLSQKSHIQQILDTMNFNIQLCDSMRAEVIREFL